MSPDETSVNDDDGPTNEWALDERYHLKRCLGSGGMGDVLLAEDTTLQRMVAIKTVRADLSRDPEMRRRIERECLMHARVGPHPHIVTLFDRYEQNGQINLVMEYVDGETLESLLDNCLKHGAPMPPEEALAIVGQILEALGRIHAVGIVHRDIKPPNIMLAVGEGDQPLAKLMDFGIARPAEGTEPGAQLTKMGSGGPGTPLYMAPEQIDPNTYGPISPATDIYALGVMLYQMVAGRPPFQGSLTTIFNGHLNAPPPPIKPLRGSEGVEIAAKLIAKALAKHPKERYGSAREFREAIDKALGAVAEWRERTDPLRKIAPEKKTEKKGEKKAEPVAAGGRSWFWPIAALLMFGGVAVAGVAAVAVYAAKDHFPALAKWTGRGNKEVAAVITPEPDKGEETMLKPVETAAPTPRPTQTATPTPTPRTTASPSPTATPTPWPTPAPTPDAKEGGMVITVRTPLPSPTPRWGGINPLGTPVATPTPAATAIATTTPAPTATPAPTPSTDRIAAEAKKSAEAKRKAFLEIKVNGRNNEKQQDYIDGQAKMEAGAANEQKGSYWSAREDYAAAAELFQKAIDDYSSKDSGFQIR